jgi:hypothetical protein
MTGEPSLTEEKLAGRSGLEQINYHYRVNRILCVLVTPPFERELHRPERGHRA